MQRSISNYGKTSCRFFSTSIKKLKPPLWRKYSIEPVYGSVGIAIGVLIYGVTSEYAGQIHFIDPPGHADKLILQGSGKTDCNQRMGFRVTDLQEETSIKSDHTFVTALYLHGIHDCCLRRSNQFFTAIQFMSANSEIRQFERLLS